MLAIFFSSKMRFRSGGDQMEDRTMIRHEMESLQESTKTSQRHHMIIFG